MDADTIAKAKLPQFVDVIFANGEDDDLFGIAAAFSNRPVQYLEKIYKPGEDITVAFKQIVMSKFLAVEDADGRTLVVIGNGLGAPHIARTPRNKISRTVGFSNCTFLFQEGGRAND